MCPLSFLFSVSLNLQESVFVPVKRSRSPAPDKAVLSLCINCRQFKGQIVVLPSLYAAFAATAVWLWNADSTPKPYKCKWSIQREFPHNEAVMRPTHAIKFTENACRATITDYGKDNVALAHTHTHTHTHAHTRTEKHTRYSLSSLNLLSCL